MDLSFDWREALLLTLSPLEIIVRGTLMYWVLFLLFRFVVRRDIGSLGIADLLLVVIVADAAQNGMAGNGESVADAVLLVVTLIAWNRLIDLLAYHSPAFQRFAEPRKVLLVRNGTKLRENMRRESITDEELEAKYRQEGLESIDEVKALYLEADGKVSVVKKK
ncbi:DUF421 domain-containing protein [Cupriavidus necator]|uniref:DUF421 domain-containing protein n=1 Tax=Cupriavidus necator (strain ATCC 17699 / DSM 428 / KCTC 22496 / NCIMB 10442 / H16 / Stanier 337) TaxID=381666 RepID=Q0K3A2_CUPNH|nr:MULTISPECIES: YetF domain-containing protein [Cupriavidus]EON19080.1 hypothetical protein C265_14115 [Cupriavidus sp. GA3-3]KUE87511.1 hypothetical protein ASL20_18330 [Cupriavidus necator]QCC03423.1 DUF421 domain-containing protein [Cupriavidus necator H16]QQB80479.1 DUF421 domain-containing protein [Cupriavidus necator]WKA44761.1 DUF421 domain-containing protein [Cupriavidus necator]